MLCIPPRRGVTLQEMNAKFAKEKKSREMGRLQKGAMSWVGMIWTELIIIMLVLLDFSLTIYETTLSPGELLEGNEMNPLNVVTGCILLIFLFEMSVRVYGYRTALLFRVLDLVNRSAPSLPCALST